MPSSKEKKREAYLKNRDKILEQAKLKYQQNKNVYLEYQKKYRKKNRNIIAKKSKDKRNSRLLKAVALLGGKCSRCLQVFDPVCYDFHHTDPSSKEFTISENMLVSESRLLAEVSKCKLLCANCHRLTHKEINNDN